jgi:hypothetical protein
MKPPTPNQRAYREYLQSSQWQSLRRWAIAVLGDRCAFTGRKLQPYQIQVHHVRYPKNWYDSKVADLVILSPSAHRLLHFYQKQGMISAFDEQGIRIARGLAADGKGHRGLCNKVLNEWWGRPKRRRRRHR